MKVTVALTTAFTFLTEIGVDALPADPFCYGYGSVYGTPDQLMRDDMERVVSQEVGQNGRYVNKIMYYFEGKSYLNLFYSDRDDATYEEQSGWRHGASPFGTQPFEPGTFDIEEGDTIVGPAAVFYNTNLRAFAFEQKLATGASVYQILEPFGATQLETFAEFNARVNSDNTYENTLWSVDDQTKMCMLNPVDTTLVGFASTKENENAKKIKSIQPIYYSTSVTVCGCLDGSPALGSMTVVESEPFKGTDTIGKLWASGQLDVVINTILFVIAVTLGLGVIGCCLCFWSSYQFPKRKLARDSQFYEDLALETKQKNDDKEAEYQKYKKHGIKLHDKSASSEHNRILSNKSQGSHDSMMGQVKDLARVSKGRLSSMHSLEEISKMQAVNPGPSRKKLSKNYTVEMTNMRKVGEQVSSEGSSDEGQGSKMKDKQQ